MATGIVCTGSMIKMSDITDGTSCTYLIGEKSLDPDDYYTSSANDAASDNESALTGDNDDFERWANPLSEPTWWAMTQPRQDMPGVVNGFPCMRFGRRTSGRLSDGVLRRLGAADITSASTRKRTVGWRTARTACRSTRRIGDWAPDTTTRWPSLAVRFEQVLLFRLAMHSREELGLSGILPHHWPSQWHTPTAPRGQVREKHSAA